jgi:hypothetical protein
MDTAVSLRSHRYDSLSPSPSRKRGSICVRLRRWRWIPWSSHGMTILVRLPGALSLSKGQRGPSLCGADELVRLLSPGSTRKKRQLHQNTSGSTRKKRQLHQNTSGSTRKRTPVHPETSGSTRTQTRAHPEVFGSTRTLCTEHPEGAGSTGEHRGGPSRSLRMGSQGSTGCPGGVRVAP